MINIYAYGGPECRRRRRRKGWIFIFYYGTMPLFFFFYISGLAFILYFINM